MLTAAIACELKVKYVLRTKAKPEAAELLYVLLENPRDFSVGAAALFNRPMKAISGRSLRDDDRALRKNVEQLFRTRNDIAHRGRAPTDDEGMECLRAAVRAFRWLDSLG